MDVRARLLAEARSLEVGSAELVARSEALAASANQLKGVVDFLSDGGTQPPAPWCSPVGTPDHPAEDWYSYTVHDLTGRRNAGYGHTGLDLNARWGGRGNADVGQPVFAVTDGEVVSVGWSDRYCAGIVLRVNHFGVPLYVRYWHLERQTASMFSVGDLVSCGANLGHIDVYPSGYAHLHFDMAWQPFEWNWWFTRHPEIEWANPKWVLMQHLDHALVERITERG